MDEPATFLTELSDNKRRVGYKLKTLPPIRSQSTINYEHLNTLSNTLDDSSLSREETHRLFMENYSMIFKSKCDLQSIEPAATSAQQKTKKNSKTPDNFGEQMGNHNISVHLSKLRKRIGSPRKEAVSLERIKAVRKIGRKMLFDRTSRDNQQLLNALMYTECFSHISKRILERLVATAQLEKWEEGYTVFGDSGLYLILKGSVSPQSAVSYIDTKGTQRKECSFSLPSTPDSFLQSLFKLSVGDYFGTLEKVPENEHSTRYLSVTTLENCELLRFSNASYERVVKQVKEEEDDEKLQLAQSCQLFKGWPVMSLKKISQTFNWFKVPAGETLAVEGVLSTNISFIKSGRCQLKKTLSVGFTYPDGKKVKKRKELVIGLLEKGDSFGERSLITRQPSEQSVISDTPLVIASINKKDIQGLDEVTRALFRQTCEAADSGTSEEKIQMQYVEKQAEMDWQSTKAAIVNETLNHLGIQPGYSKWSRNPSASEVQHFAGSAS